MASAALRNGDDNDAGVEVTLPDGTVTTDDEALTAWLGHPVALRAASPDVSGTYEIADGLRGRGRQRVDLSWRGPRGSFHDSPRTQVSLVSTATIAGWDRRRFRANVVLAGDGEDDSGRLDRRSGPGPPQRRQAHRPVRDHDPPPAGRDRP